MAESHDMVLNHVLCFLLSKYHKCEARTVKSAILCFYNAEDIHGATTLFLDIVSTLKDSDKLSKFTRRRDSKERCVHEIDDLFSVMSELDEKKMLSELPMFVSNSSENMPSNQLTEGDMRAIMKRRANTARAMKSSNGKSHLVGRELRNVVVSISLTVNNPTHHWKFAPPSWIPLFSNCLPIFSFSVNSSMLERNLVHVA